MQMYGPKYNAELFSDISVWNMCNNNNSSSKRTDRKKRVAVWIRVRGKCAKCKKRQYKVSQTIANCLVHTSTEPSNAKFRCKTKNTHTRRKCGNVDGEGWQTSSYPLTKMPMHTHRTRAYICSNIFDVSNQFMYMKSFSYECENSSETWYCSSICRISMNASFHLSQSLSHIHWQHMTNDPSEKRRTTATTATSKSTTAHIKHCIYCMRFTYSSRFERIMLTWNENRCRRWRCCERRVEMDKNAK